MSLRCSRAVGAKAPPIPRSRPLWPHFQFLDVLQDRDTDLDQHGLKLADFTVSNSTLLQVIRREIASGIADRSDYQPR